ncbi:SRPBCC domain-containing protein [Candidatus Nitrosocosmicus hydrocola]|uniref:SRPBCC domain-containing protein n=1 Tax=Candidatus Nitrosocosmicus hydrocola TaxID=1826872 RepID=UPI000A67C499|nr:SRPBCC domain-containing protein [Candidatus Nitrosocosmicus hydrocola]
MVLKFTVQAKIKKPIDEVFDAIYNPKKLSKYFTTGGANGFLEEDNEVMWDFHDYPGSFPIYVIQTIKNQKIVFEWASAVETNRLKVEITFESIGEDSTLVKISESGWTNEDQASLDESYSNCQGWTQMICSLKTYLEYDKNLREFYY